MIDVMGMREAAAKVQMIMPGHGVMLNAAYVIALCDAYEAVKKERDQARRYLGYSEGQTLEEAGLADNRRDRIRGITALLNKAREGLKPLAGILLTNDHGKLAFENWADGRQVFSVGKDRHITVGDLRTAHAVAAEIEAALAPETKKPPEANEGSGLVG